VRLGPHHVQAALRSPVPSALVLEFESDQWVLYFWDADDKITGAHFPGSFEAAMRYAEQWYGIKPDEWIEDFSH